MGPYESISYRPHPAAQLIQITLGDVAVSGGVLTGREVNPDGSVRQYFDRGDTFDVERRHAIELEIIERRFSMVLAPQGWLVTADPDVPWPEPPQLPGIRQRLLNLLSRRS